MRDNIPCREASAVKLAPDHTSKLDAVLVEPCFKQCLLARREEKRREKRKQKREEKRREEKRREEKRKRREEKRREEKRREEKRREEKRREEKRREEKRREEKRKGKERKGKERKGKERKGKERKGKEEEEENEVKKEARTERIREREPPSPPPRAHVQQASVCSFKTPSCEATRRPHVEHRMSQNELFIHKVWSRGTGTTEERGHRSETVTPKSKRTRTRSWNQTTRATHALAEVRLKSCWTPGTQVALFRG